ncbi:MAG: anthranilate phosphoribosyltransferase [Chloroflexota bacterium]|jgi:anthranilate phosphoribosyltransferase|nr:anthranilate phosphoribosyltransferase [Chloroflexota bacterium]
MIRDAIGRLVAGEDLDRATAQASMDNIMSGEATASQVAGFLIGLRMKGETVEEMVGLVTSMREHATTITAPDGAVDTCGTGGDGSGTFNISTTAALVIRGAGATVAKHGNRKSSSLCGSADVLEELGVPIGLTPAQVERCIAQAGIGFMLAPTFHPAMRHAGPTRQELGVRTVFNLLGPLANPARVRRQAVGVASVEVAPKMVEVLSRLGHERALVFSSDDGLDELSTVAVSRVWELRDGAVREYTVDCAELGLPQATAADIRGGDARVNARIVIAVLEGEDGPARDVVVLNAAAGLVAAGLADELAEGVELARASLDNGAARAALEELRATASEIAYADG